MSKIAQNVTELIGKTPLVKINRLNNGAAAEVVAKLEFFNPASSVKDRIAFAMISDAEQKGPVQKPESEAQVEAKNGAQEAGATHFTNGVDQLFVNAEDERHGAA